MCGCRGSAAGGVAVPPLHNQPGQLWGPTGTPAPGQPTPPTPTLTHTLLTGCCKRYHHTPLVHVLHAALCFEGEAWSWYQVQ